MRTASELRKAPELRVAKWIDGDGKDMAPLKLADLGEGFRILFNFQHWCPGCHARGFPTLKYLRENLSEKGFGFAVIQTVFEGAEVNTLHKLRVNQLKYGLNIPFGHDEPAAGESHPSMMADYRTNGTPWFTVIDPQGKIVYADFHLDPQSVVDALAG